MKFTVLGSGTAIQYQNRASACYLLEDEGYTLLLDAGFSVMDRLSKAGTLANEVDSAFISHSHPDHSLGIIHILFALKNKHMEREKPFQLFGFPGLIFWTQGFRDIMGSWIDPECGLEISEDEEGRKGPFGYTVFPVEHTGQSSGIAIEWNGRKVVYTGDTGYFDELGDYAQDADLFVADCGCSSEEPLEGHMNLEEVKCAVKGRNVKKVLLSHIYPETGELPERWEEDGTLFMRAEDLLSLEL
ncbi:MBL fold metallo-hydrolase [Limisalsivibrio acetivorans]|uniref:MBL fold metallo-hydrolase n=1 Tax=Limisalsivibrio acetivorans TaxID=1304888 RepID=UPI0003B4CB2E|nr:ribonuclease Z [Limisalsivibrio acetivorans]